MTYARIQRSVLGQDVVAELFTPPDGVSIRDCFHASLVWVEIPAGLDVQPNWTYDGHTFAPPE